jgi:hypothetical protein
MQTRLKNTLSGMARAGLCAAIALGFTTGSVLAHDKQDNDNHYDHSGAPHETPHKAEPPSGGHASLALAANNPIANLIQVELQNLYTPSNYNSDGYSNVAIFQPIMPFDLPWEKVPLLVTRTTLPYISTPDLDGGVGRKDGFGDIVAQGYFIPKLKTKGVMVGVGYNLVIPTAGDNEYVGSGKWSLGPAAVYFNMKSPSVQWGLLGYSSFSFANAANSDRDYVSNVSIQPILVKNFDKGWYLGVPDEPQTYDFNTNEWTFNLGGRLGRVMKLGKQPVNLFGQATYNPNDDIVAPEWTLKVNLTLLFPK